MYRVEEGGLNLSNRRRRVLVWHHTRCRCCYRDNYVIFRYYFFPLIIPTWSTVEGELGRVNCYNYERLKVHRNISYGGAMDGRKWWTLSLGNVELAIIDVVKCAKDIWRSSLGSRHDRGTSVDIHNSHFAFVHTTVTPMKLIWL